MIDKLSLTTHRSPDREYLKTQATIVEDKHRANMYKYICRLDKATLLFHPHKFGELMNMRISETKIDLNPKYFNNLNEMLNYLFLCFDYFDVEAKDFKVTRIDIAADIENFPIDSILSVLRVNKINTDTLSFFKGTLYAGSDPKIRIYEKVKEIKSRMRAKKKKVFITDYERKLVESGKSYTRFEIQIRTPNKFLPYIIDNSESFASYYDRLEIFNFPDNDGGILQFLYKHINRKFRAQLEQYRNYPIVETIKNQYIESVRNWITCPPTEAF